MTQENTITNTDKKSSILDKITSVFENEKYKNLAFTFARILIGYMFISHGTAKFFEFPVSMTGGNGAVGTFSIYGIAGMIELVFGFMFMVGFYQRFASFILSGQMAVAYFFFHANLETVLFPMQNKGELALVYSLIFLMFAFIKNNCCKTKCNK